MKKCIVCGKKFEGKMNVCSQACLDIYLYGSTEKAREVNKKNFEYLFNIN